MKMTRKKRVGWRGEAARHSLAARGIETKRFKKLGFEPKDYYFGEGVKEGLRPRKSPDKSSTEDFLAMIDANWRRLKEKDAQAKARGTLVGRYIKEPYADGYAVYEITRANPKSVHIKVVRGIGDDWEIPYWGSEATIKRSYAEENIRRREVLERLFSGHSKSEAVDAPGEAEAIEAMERKISKYETDYTGEYTRGH
jgi:hypothetical protein